MSFDKFLHGRIFLIRWRVPAVSDGMQLLREVEAAHGQSGAKLIYLAVAPSDSPPPPEDLRKIMASHVDAMLQHCEMMHLVFEGVGFSQTIKRMALASIVLVSGMKGRMLVHDSLDAAMASTTPALRPELVKALKAYQTWLAKRGPTTQAR
jgi:hypothetical protein